MVKRFLLFKILKKYSHPSIVLLPLFSLFIAVCMGSASKFLSLIVDVVPSGSFMTAILFLAVSVVLRMLSTIAQSIRDYYSDKLSERLAFSIQKDVLEKLDRIPFSTFEEENTQNLVYRIYTNGKIEGINMFRSLSTGLYGILITIIYAVLLGNIVWYIPLLFVLFSLSSMFVSIRFGVSQYILKRQKSKTEQRATYYERLLLRCDAAKEVRFYGLVNTLKERYIDLRKKLAKEERQQITKHIFLELFGKLLQAMGLFLCLAILVTQYYDNTGFVLLSDILLVFNIGLSFFDELNGALLELRNITRFYAFAEDSLSFLELEEEKRDSFPSDVNNIIDIEFDHVSFAYPGSDEYAVRDINVHLRRGEKVICVGENGAGKSTFLMLMLGLYQPTEGEIRVNGISLKGREQEFRKQCCSAILQHYTKYNMTVKENIELSNQNGVNTEKRDKIIQNLIGFVQDLPSGMQTFLGNLTDGASNLSEGQWQRVRICNTLLRNAPILILDEPTASLDPIAEAALHADLIAHLTDQLCVISTHRLGICKLADQILVFHDGKVLETGTHKELIKKNGRYCSLFHSQRKLIEE